MEPIWYNLKRLFLFSGRESRELFWPYVGAVYLATMVGGMAIFVPTFISTFARAQQFAVDHPDQATVTTGPGTYSIQIEGNHPELAPDFVGLLVPVAIVTAIAAALLAAAVTRRLHDRGMSGAWGLLPLPFLASGFLLMGQAFSSMDGDISQVGFLFLNNLTYLAALGLLAFLLAGKTQPHDNRYGPVSAP